MTEDILKLAGEYVNRETHDIFRNEVQALLDADDADALRDRFYKDLDFGTGGMRGEIGGGYNRMNTFMIRKATQGLANYVNKAVSGGSAVIAYDSRNYSDTFAEEAACVLAANGITTYLFSALRPTPELSYAVRKLGATTGIVITASHNPKEYNGYKVYWDDGGQIIPPHDNGIISEVRSVDTITSSPKDELVAAGTLKFIDKEIDDPFIQVVMDASIRPELVKEKGSELSVVYSPLHGAGAMPVSVALGKMGINVTFVPEQKEPDGNFPTAAFPNPEEKAAMAMALELGKKVKADLVMATDPDADRLGIAVPEGDEYLLVTGNQLGSLLADYVMSSRKEQGTMPAKPAFIKTIVTTELQRMIAEDYGVLSIDVLTGFKFIGAKIAEFEAQENGPEFIFGGEESYGYLAHTEARDKDAVSAATLTAEMALYHVSQGRSLMDQLGILWKKYGYYQEALISQYFKGEQGVSVMQGLMDGMRTDAPKTFAGSAVALVKDFKDGSTLDAATGEKKKNIDLPSSNVIQLVLADGTVITARPSGTEPKIKFYVSAHSEPGMELAAAKVEVGAKIDSIETDIKTLIAAAG